ncbi:hypothetical protein RIF29_09440 [Crotalaria pallida]|uniref:Uncharacterized protein n=1 Tax=Crotalaria pallida TaxID=3830 RepID=A0AAN9FUH1_CROPI
MERDLVGAGYQAFEDSVLMKLQKVISIPLLQSYPFIAMLTGLTLYIVISLAVVLKSLLAEQHQRGEANGIAMTLIFSNSFNAKPQRNNEQEHWCAFGLAPFKHGVYSIAFDSSLSLLQAFSICIALVDSNMPYELSIVMDEHQRSNGILVTRFTLQSIYAQSDDEKLEFENESGNTNILDAAEPKNKEKKGALKSLQLIDAILLSEMG